MHIHSAWVWVVSKLDLYSTYQAMYAFFDQK